MFGKSQRTGLYQTALPSLYCYGKRHIILCLDVEQETPGSTRIFIFDQQPFKPGYSSLALKEGHSGVIIDIGPEGACFLGASIL
jgi:hypothetical protein